MIGSRHVYSLAMALCLAVAWPVAAAAPEKQDPGAAAVAPAAAASCEACHGTRGAMPAQDEYPYLAGLNADYLRHQLDAFASGKRSNPVMSPVAKALAADQREAVAKYFSGLPAPARPHRLTAGAGDATRLGEQLALRGRWGQGLPACVQCHGPAGRGVGADFPALAGQSPLYLVAQLEAWKSGKRSGEPLALMSVVASKLSGADIAAVASWFAAQSPRSSE